MALDWIDHLKVIKAQLRALPPDRCVLYSAIVHIGDSDALHTHNMVPHVYASGGRIVFSETLQLPEGGLHVHCLFAGGFNEVDDGLLTTLQGYVKFSTRIPRPARINRQSRRSGAFPAIVVHQR